MAFCENFEDDVCYRGGQEVSCDANPNSRTGNRLAPGSDDDQAVKRYNDLKGTVNNKVLFPCLDSNYYIKSQSRNGDEAFQEKG